MIPVAAPAAGVYKPKDATSETIYAEHTEAPESWCSPRPSFDVEKFNQELEKRGGTIGSVPRFRLKWAPDDDAYCLNEVAFWTGYTYAENGEEKFVSNTQTDFEFPDDAVVAPKYEYEKFYIPRWVVEQYHEGSYALAWVIERVESVSEQSGHKVVMSHYVEPAEHDLQLAEGARYLGETLTAEDIAKGLAKRNAQKAKDYQDKKRDIKEDNAYWADKYMRDGVPDRVISIPKQVVPKNIAKEQIANI